VSTATKPPVTWDRLVAQYRATRWKHLEEQIRALLVAHEPAEFLHAKVTGSAKASSVARVPGTRHVAHDYEFYFVAEGRLSLKTPAHTFVLRPGQLLLIDPGVEHEELPATPATPHLRYCLQLVGTTAELFEVRYTPPARRVETALNLVGPEDLGAISAAISCELSYRGEDWQGAVHALLRYLGMTLLRRFRAGNVGENTNPRLQDYQRWPVLHAVLAYCTANLRGSCSMRDIAAQVGYSPSHLGRIVTSYLGIPLSQHVRELRMSVAMDLVEHSDLTVTQIAEHVGYRYPWHFTRAFTRATGTSPTAFRKTRRAARPAD
jgi:AraC-like DNA-binding protein/mannose-6-phosphate isomerase-like protein (cupin superfamily)